MRSTQAIENIASFIRKNNGINLTFCVCDNKQFNTIVRAYRSSEISLKDAASQALSTIIEQPKN